MFDEAPLLNLEDVVADDIHIIRSLAIDSIFSPNQEERVRNMRYLLDRFPNLKGGTVKGNYVVLEFQLEGCLRLVRAATIPNKYMDVAYNYFQIT